MIFSFIKVYYKTKVHTYNYKYEFFFFDFKEDFYDFQSYRLSKYKKIFFWQSIF